MTDREDPVELADVNVLVALVWESHLHHAAAVGWARRTTRFATCAITQTGFVRVSSNARVIPGAISVAEATAVLSELTTRDDHRFLVDGEGFIGNPHIEYERLVGHRQITDAQIVGVARQHDALVATLDRGLAEYGGKSVRLITLSP